MKSGNLTSLANRQRSSHPQPQEVLSKDLLKRGDRLFARAMGRADLADAEVPELFGDDRRLALSEPAQMEASAPVVPAEL